MVQNLYPKNTHLRNEKDLRVRLKFQISIWILKKQQNKQEDICSNVYQYIVFPSIYLYAWKKLYTFFKYQDQFIDIKKDLWRKKKYDKMRHDSIFRILSAASRSNTGSVQSQKLINLKFD